MERKTKKLNARSVKSIPLEEKGQRVYWDSELVGFGLVVGKASKSYIVQRSVHGRSRRVTVGRHGVFTASEARDEARRLLNEMALGTDPVERKRREAREAEAERKSKRTLRQLWEEFQKVRTLKPSTLRSYKGQMNTSFKNWQARPVREITKQDVRELHQRIGKTRAPYANQAARVLSSILNFGVDHGYLSENPARLPRKAAFVVKPRKTRVAPDQLAAWFKGVEHLRSHGEMPSAKVAADLFELLMMTGLRKNEALGLSWDRVDLKKRVFKVADTKNGKPLTLPITGEMMKIFERRKEAADAVKSKWVFPSPGRKNMKGHMADPRSASALVREQAGLKFTLHDLRRSFTLAANRDQMIGYALVKSILNHASANRDDITLAYFSAGPEDLREPMERLHAFYMERKAEALGLKITATTAAG